MASQRPDEWLNWIDRPGASEGEAPAPGEHDSAYDLLQRGHELMRGRHHAQASIVLERAARLEPRKGSILEALGRAYYNSGQHRLAAETFSLLLEVDPTAHYAHYALGQSFKQLGRLPQARTHLRLAVALSPTSKLYRSALDRLPILPKEGRQHRNEGGRGSEGGSNGEGGQTVEGDDRGLDRGPTGQRDNGRTAKHEADES